MIVDNGGMQGSLSGVFPPTKSWLGQPQSRRCTDLRIYAVLLGVAEMCVAWKDCICRTLRDACVDAVADGARAHGNRVDCHEQV